MNSEPGAREPFILPIRPTGVGIILFLALWFPTPASSIQVPSGDLRPGSTVVATPQGRYDAGGLHRFFLGGLNRDLWPLPIEVQVLDLDRYAGGLTILRRGGGLQTTSLRLRGADGRLYTFRSVDKDVARRLDPQLRETVAERVLQDQIGALFPLSAMVVAPLLEAAGVLHPDPTLVVMPRDERLGEFLDEFGGLLGWIEIRPDEGGDGTPGFAGSTRVTGSERFLERIEDEQRNRVNGESYLRARLMDLFVGDWDRHPDQWRWAAFEEGDSVRWEPIPRDRDWALSRIDGFFISLGRTLLPHYVGFSRDYTSVFGSTWNGRALDRDLLSQLVRADFERVASDLQERLTDEVIMEAVGRLPTSYQETLGAELEDALRNRRDRLLDAALAFYGILSGWVDIFGTDEEDYALVERQPDGALRVAVWEATSTGVPRGAPYFDRIFVPDETHEVRIFLRGDDDRAVVRGVGSDAVRVRIVGGGSDDTLIDETDGRGTSFYDDRGDNRFTLARHTYLDESDYDEPEDTESATHQARPRDWGSRWTSLPLIGVNSDVGLFVGETAHRYGYGFRHFPQKTRLDLSSMVNPIQLGFQAGVGFEFPLARGSVFGRIKAAATNREIRRFFGFGNETVRDRPSAEFRADRSRVSLETLVEFRPGPTTSFAFGPALWFSSPTKEEGTFVEAEAPYGFDDFVRVGLLGRLTLDTRDNPVAARRGVRFSVEGRYVPEALDAEAAYGGLSGTLSASVPLGSAGLSVRVSGEKLWGDFPFFDGAWVGGNSTLRGFSEYRFVGDAAVTASAQLRSPGADFFLFLPGEVGVMALSDVGRVYLDGEDSDTWHSAFGGGLWAYFLKPSYTVSLAWARSEEGNKFYLSLGFGY
ncbi:MAG: BamA/TamA family outer membrane protein [Longimicrobiales bacterium]